MKLLRNFLLDSSSVSLLLSNALVIIIGALLADQALLILFLILKTATDLLTHTLKHQPEVLTGQKS